MKTAVRLVKDECLDERHQDLNEINEYREQDPETGI